MSQFFNFNKTKIKTKNYQNLNTNLLINDLDSFFRNIYDYYYLRGFKNIFASTILDNISYLFSIHFTIFNLYILDWPLVLNKCMTNDICNLELTEYINLDYFQNNFISLMFLYSYLMSYYFIYLYKSMIFLYKMKRIKNLFYNKFHIRQKEMENMKFDEILQKLIELQKNENFSRVKENLTKYDIISRLTRKENYCLSIFSNYILDFELSIPIIGRRNFFSNYLYNNLSECVMNFIFIKGDVNVNPKFFNLRYLQMKMFLYMLIEIFFIPSIIFFKVTFWIFKNADNLKSSRNINERVWSSHVQVLFKNYNELPHHFEKRIKDSYKYVQPFINLYKDKMISILGKFILLICGSFIILIFVISTIEDRLLTELKIYGKKFVWITFFIGFVLNFFSNNNSDDIDYIENVKLKEDLYKKIINNCINIPSELKQKQNFSSVFKIILKHYDYGILSLVKEILSIIIFPISWMKLIFKADILIKFVKSNTKNVDGVGSIYNLSHLDLASFKSFKEKDYNMSNLSFNDFKFINSYLYFHQQFKMDENEVEIYSEINTSKDYKFLIDKIYESYKNNLISSQHMNFRDENESKHEFEAYLFYHISQVDFFKLDQ
jgi:autophagy-related protein 9